MSGTEKLAELLHEAALKDRYDPLTERCEDVDARDPVAQVGV